MISKKIRIIKIITKTLKTKKKLDLNCFIGSIEEWDSLAHINIYINLQKEFGTINLKRASKVRSIKDWLEVIG